MAGLGRLGRQRYPAVAEGNGARVAREAKAMAPSACVWAGTPGAVEDCQYPRILVRASRAADPWVAFAKGGWLVRRLAPYCSRIELSQLPKLRDEAKLLYAMGFETANIHWGTPTEIPAIRKDLHPRRASLLDQA